MKSQKLTKTALILSRVAAISPSIDKPHTYRQMDTWIDTKKTTYLFIMDPLTLGRDYKCYEPQGKPKIPVLRTVLN